MNAATKQKVLLLSLKKEWFDLMITGEKDFELREKSKWIESRLFYANGHEKEYDLVKFINGYGIRNNKPFFTAEFSHATLEQEGSVKFKDGTVLNWNTPHWKIHLGKVINKGNIK